MDVSEDPGFVTTYFVAQKKCFLTHQADVASGFLASAAFCPFLLILCLKL